jgi:hypothetical protein
MGRAAPTSSLMPSCFTESALPYRSGPAVQVPFGRIVLLPACVVSCPQRQGKGKWERLVEQQGRVDGDADTSS